MVVRPTYALAAECGAAPRAKLNGNRRSTAVMNNKSVSMPFLIVLNHTIRTIPQVLMQVTREIHPVGHRFTAMSGHRFPRDLMLRSY